MLAYFRARAIPGVEHVTEDAYRRSVVVDGRGGVLELSRDGPGRLRLRVLGGPVDAAERARRIFSLDAPAERAAEALGGDPVIGPLVAARPGLRVPGTWDPFETGIRAIIGQQVSVAGANTIIGRLVARFGSGLREVDRLGVSHTFPTAHELAVADLRGLGLPGARAAAIAAFAAAVERGEVRLDGTMTLDELTRAITAVRGLGPWTAHYIALRLGEPDAFPANDLGLRRALEHVAPAERRPLPDLAEAWSPWRATAAIHLWQAYANAAATTRRGGLSSPGRRRSHP
jgi:AraC family transcriptional regulator of adaptative response / DNA-3-methyladenine glycosylase II